MGTKGGWERPTPVIDVPRARDLHHLRRLVLLHRLHPRVRVRLVVRVDQRVFRHVRNVVRLAVVVQHRVIVLDAKVLQDRHGLGPDLPGRRDPALGVLAGELLVHLDGLGHDFALLLLGEEADELVRVAVKAAKMVGV